MRISLWTFRSKRSLVGLRKKFRVDGGQTTKTNAKPQRLRLNPDLRSLTLRPHLFRIMQPIAYQGSVHPSRRDRINPRHRIQTHDLVLYAPDEAILQACLTTSIFRVALLAKFASLRARQNDTDILQLRLFFLLIGLNGQQEMFDRQERASDINR